ncbi:hypothetical protein BH09BAC4_BH09BAC4_29530 [soil metagenome]
MPCSTAIIILTIIPWSVSWRNLFYAFQRHLTTFTWLNTHLSGATPVQARLESVRIGQTEQGMEKDTKRRHVDAVSTDRFEE